ncbi:hypothetical protein RhiirA5_378152 [Rhizophagus irregularis]|uniref:DUF7431 domain-containing protein n=1 Tax=Rhizophagus irregularis TaxID=588596 RepID=A0A2N0PGT1_9GLOM|nr:hypothetical protein RhiirA5_378152 [Rhizophagus irregularis]
MNEIIDGYENSIIQIDLGEGPTKEFIEVVKGVIDSKDPRKFKNVINSFGQFIPKEIILGGRAYFIARGNSEENADEYTTNIDNILEILQNKDAECSIFATVIDKKQKDIFNCQVVWSSTEDPKLIIHCFQNKFRKRQCKLKIMWMIVGYNTSFDFNHLDFDIELEVLKNDFNASNHQAIAKPLDLKYNPSVLCFGIPVLSKLDTSNNSPVIGHYFFDDKENRKFGSYLFFYCLE